MIENIGQPGYETISQPDPDVISWVRAQLEADNCPRYAEIGVGIGATTLEVCRLLNNRGEVHLFDFDTKIAQLMKDLAAEGFTNVQGHPNQRLHWDSYVWPLLVLLKERGGEYFDYVYLDGAHTIFHDLPAYLVAKKLLRNGGILDLDDYYWSWGGSPHMNPEKTPWVKQCMTDEQIGTPQIKMLVDLFVDQDADFEVVRPKKVYRKKSCR